MIYSKVTYVIVSTWMFHARVSLSATVASLSQDGVCVEQFADYSATDH